MRKTKEQKAITLIALIITIVVLLILAVVAINAVTGDGIIQHAVNAKTAYENAQAKEEDILSYYQEYLNAEGNLGPWKQVEDKITMVDSEGNTIEIPIGAKVNYTPEVGRTYTSYSSKTGISEDQIFTTTDEDLEWIVIGLENKKIMLMASKGVVPDGENKYCLNGAEGYNNGIQELNNICSIYMNAEYAEKARSLNEEDIDKMAGLTEEIKKSETEAYYNATLGAEGILNYEAKYLYKYDGEKLTFAKNDGVDIEIAVENNTICFPDGTEIGEQGTVGTKEVQTSLSYMDIGDNNELNAKIKDELSRSNKWIASRGSAVYNENNGSFQKGYIEYGIKGLSNNNILGVRKMYDSCGVSSEPRSNYTVCPVVTLKAGVTLTKVANGVYDIN